LRRIKNESINKTTDDYSTRLRRIKNELFLEIIPTENKKIEKKEF